MLVDFGIARRTDSERLTATGTPLGTPSYMAPEQARGERVFDVRTDVYGLGGLLYAVLTGQPPVLKGSALATIAAVARDPVRAPRSISPQTPKALERICMKALSRDPADRYSDAAAFATALRKSSLAEDASTLPAGRLAAGAGALLACAALALLPAWQARNPGDPPGSASALSTPPAPAATLHEAGRATALGQAHLLAGQLAAARGVWADTPKLLAACDLEEQRLALEDLIVSRHRSLMTNDAENVKNRLTKARHLLEASRTTLPLLAPPLRETLAARVATTSVRVALEWSSGPLRGHGETLRAFVPEVARALPDQSAVATLGLAALNFEFLDSPRRGILPEERAEIALALKDAANGAPLSQRWSWLAWALFTRTRGAANHAGTPPSTPVPRGAALSIVERSLLQGAFREQSKSWLGRLATICAKGADAEAAAHAWRRADAYSRAALDLNLHRSRQALSKARRLRAVVLLWAKRYVQARALVLKLTSARMQEPRECLLIECTLLKGERPTRADVTFLQSLITQNPTPRLHALRAACFQRRGDSNNASRDLARARLMLQVEERPEGFVQRPAETVLDDAGWRDVTFADADLLDDVSDARTFLTDALAGSGH